MTPEQDPKRERIAVEAAEWFTDLREGELSEADQKRFSQWLAESPVHVAEYLGIAEVWGGLHAGESWPEQSTDQALEVVRAAARAREVPIIGSGADPGASRARVPPDGRSRPQWKWVFASLAASILLLVGVTVFQSSRSDNHTFITGRGEQRSIVLSDGSVIQLNTLSKVVIEFDSARRRVRLPEGEAYFRVAHDAARPFEVATPFATVRALGTEFNVYNHADSTLVAVIEGRVLVGGEARSSAQSALELKADEQVTVSQATPARPVPLRNQGTTAWIQRRIILDDDRLDAAVQEFNRYNKQRLLVGDADIAALPISGVFNADDPGALLKYLQRIEGIEARPVDGTLVLQRVGSTH